MAEALHGAGDAAPSEAGGRCAEESALQGVAVVIDDKDKLIAALKIRLAGSCCEVCWTNSWVPIPTEADANGVNVLKEPREDGTVRLFRCDFCWQEWATGQLVRQLTAKIRE
jgi:hypothetical protein